MCRFAFALLCILNLPSTASAYIIDDFSVGNVTLQMGDSNPTISIQSALDPAHVLGGRRTIEMASPSGFSGAQSATIDTVAKKFAFFSTTMPFGAAELYYGSDGTPLNIDITADGRQSFRIKLTDLMPGGPLPALSFQVYGADTFKAVNLHPQSNSVSDVITLQFPFEDFPQALLQDVDQIKLVAFNFGDDVQFSVLEIATAIPEPTALAIVGLGGAFLLLRRQSM